MVTLFLLHRNVVYLVLIQQNKIDWNVFLFVFSSCFKFFAMQFVFFVDKCLNILQKHPLNLIFNSSDFTDNSFFFIFFRLFVLYVQCVVIQAYLKHQRPIAKPARWVFMPITRLLKTVANPAVLGILCQQPANKKHPSLLIAFLV